MQVKELHTVSLFTLLALVSTLGYQQNSNAQLVEAQVPTQSIRNTPNLISQGGFTFSNPAEVPNPFQIQPPQPPSFPSRPSFPDTQQRGPLQFPEMPPFPGIDSTSPIEPIEPEPFRVRRSTLGSLPSYEETQRRIRNVKLSRCAINKTISRIGPSTTTGVSGSSSRSENSSSTSGGIRIIWDGGSIAVATKVRTLP